LIEGIYQIGKLVKQGKKISEILSDIPQIKEGKKYKIGKINYSLSEEKIEIDLEEEYEVGKEDRYKFMEPKKLNLTGTSNKFLATFNDKNRFLQGRKYSLWISIEDELLKMNQTHEIRNMLDKLRKIKNIFYQIAENELKLKLDKIENFNGKNEKEFNKWIKDRLGKDEEIVFWTVSVDGELVVDKKFYEELLKKKVLEEKRKKGRKNCSICNSEVDNYFDNFAKFPMKFYINDKIGFSQKLSDKWFGNFILCEDCYLSILAGEKFILNNLKDRIGRIDYLIIPEFVGDVPIKPERLKIWGDYLVSTINVFKFLEKSYFKKKLEEYKEYGYIPYFLLHYLFFEQNNNEFKVYTLIKDIPKGRLEELREGFYKYSEKIFKKFPYLNPLKGLEEIYWIIPLRISKSEGRLIDIPKLTNLFVRMLEETKLDVRELVYEFSIGLRAKYFNNTSYHIVKNQKADQKLSQKSRDEETINYILLTHQLIILLRELGLLSGGNVMLSDVPKEFKEYIEEVGFGEKETALFLLGTLIGDIGTSQARYGRKPILNKINFQGMSFERLKLLFNEVFNALKYERLLSKEKEVTYAKARELFDKHLKDWNFKPHENVYYLLSGYAFKTKLNLAKKEVRNGK